MPVEDSETGQTFDMVLRPKHIIFHQDANGAGHYYAYLRNESGGWIKHDDAKTPAESALPTIRNGLRPKLIEYEKVDLVPR